MNLNLIIDYLILSIIASFAINMIFRNIAKAKNILVDVPDRSRKFHNRATPLTGGISIIVAALISGKLYLDFNDLNGYVPLFTFNLMVTSIVLVALFLIDDFKGLRASLRLVIQAALALYMISPNPSIFPRLEI